VKDEKKLSCIECEKLSLKISKAKTDSQSFKLQNLKFTPTNKIRGNNKDKYIDHLRAENQEKNEKIKQLEKSAQESLELNELIEVKLTMIFFFFSFFFF